jgi:hypothetical protein
VSRTGPVRERHFQPPKKALRLAWGAHSFAFSAKDRRILCVSIRCRAHSRHFSRRLLMNNPFAPGARLLLRSADVDEKLLNSRFEMGAFVGERSRRLQDLRRRRTRLDGALAHVGDVGGNFRGARSGLPDIGSYLGVMTSCVSMAVAISVAISDTLPIVVMTALITSAVSVADVCIPATCALISSVAFCLGGERFDFLGDHGESSAVFAVSRYCLPRREIWNVMKPSHGSLAAG